MKLKEGFNKSTEKLEKWVATKPKLHFNEQLVYEE